MSFLVVENTHSPFFRSWDLTPCDSIMRIVHVACAAPRTNSEPDAALGVFNFTNPAAALSFAQFIVNLSQDVSRISERARTRCENNGLD
ncbi:hypothetical protein DFH07DRAFT_955392 [Mycena maculata]|uniref:Uncharacterized protein n=1 Tax=Mycena maculata TaxID=230809 RepID=A0AAD7JMF4_9AGAR|nr:hypothetical protein DFH07DRAFT_955392 [Mycena maculata]